ncbi:FAD-binding oxidoreductase [Streptomyces sp. CB02959]|uniref:FAD-binding protein n=1 Tax=Streptomyces sp. CB02959 TaxID=2020330 RepID=UPI0011AF76F8
MRRAGPIRRRWGGGGRPPSSPRSDRRAPTSGSPRRRRRRRCASSGDEGKPTCITRQPFVSRFVHLRPTSHRRIEIQRGSRAWGCPCAATVGTRPVSPPAHGLGAVTGILSGTGLGGALLHEGMGYLSPLMGYACDSLLAAELVLADGTIVRADDQTHPEPMWALRGAGSNFGVVTWMKLQPAPVPKAIPSVEIFHHGDDAVEAVKGCPICFGHQPPLGVADILRHRGLPARAARNTAIMDAPLDLPPMAIAVLIPVRMAGRSGRPWQPAGDS